MNNNIDPFYIAYRGSFTNLLKWIDLDSFWKVLLEQVDKDWYIYITAEAPPEQAATVDELKNFSQQMDRHLRQEHKEDYCGIVYVDSKTEPSYIKIYDPKNLGVVCGIGREPIFPGWILSQLPPQSLEHLPPLVDKKKTWWRRIFSFAY